jgi:DNA-binding transcriptional MerR regulator
MQLLKPKEVSIILGVAVSTLQYWDNIGKLKSFRTDNNRRYYTKNQIEEFKKYYFGSNYEE